MTIDLATKNRVLKLRKLDKSYNFIVRDLKLSKSTVACWLHDLGWSKVIKERLTEKQKVEGRKKIKLMNAARRKQLDDYYAQALQEGKKEFLLLKKNQLFVAGLMIYWGEGDKVVRNGQIRMSNTDPLMISVFYRFLKEILKVDLNKLKAWILLYPDLNEKTCLQYWIKSTGLSRSFFRKSAIIHRRGLDRKSNYGICGIGFANKYLKTKLLEWIDLLAREIVYC